MKKTKKFDCIAMKRRIQAEIFEATRDMPHREFEEYMRRRIASSRFVSFLERSPSGSTKR